jgi:hypothetical protein
MGEPGHEGAEEKGQDGVVPEAFHHEHEDPVAPQGLGGRHHHAEGHDHQTEPHHDLAGLPPGLGLGEGRERDAGDEQHRHKRRDLARERLNHDRRADIGAEHHGERGG